MNIHLIEDHDEALAIWRKHKFRGLTLLHIDAHIDFGLPAAETPLTALAASKSLRELKAGLEASLVLLRYARDFDKQTNIGNYIYSAWAEGIVRDIYWVIPGDKREFRRNRLLLGRMLKSALGRDTKPKFASRAVTCCFRGAKFTVCTLDTLPPLDKPLLDIDTDFMVTDSIRHADNTDEIGRRRICCAPQKLALALSKISRPVIATIAYSTNGGYTPMQYRHLGDELACLLNPSKFSARYRRSLAASEYFSEFQRSGSKIAYRRAVALVPAYRGPDNSTGMLWLEKGKAQQAELEFEKILRADQTNPQALEGLGRLALRARRFTKAQLLLQKALRYSAGRFKNLRSDVLHSLGEACLAMGRLEEAKKAFSALRRADPLRPLAHYFCGEVAKKQKHQNNT